MASKRTPASYVGSSHAGQANLTRRVGSRRSTRLTSAFFKRVGNRAHSAAIHTMHRNFAFIHQTVRCIPVMATDVMERPCKLASMVQVPREWEARGKGGFGH